MKTPFLTLKLVCAVCAAAFVLFALLMFALPQAKVLLAVLCAVFFLALSLNVHALQKAKKAVPVQALDRAA
jgi:hypothetical protein